MTYVIGIDVGTTRTSAAICRTGGGPADIEVVGLGDRASSIPSVIYLGADGAVVVGEAAERRAVTDPDHVVREFKRRIGDPTPLVVGGRPWAPEELSARIARWVIDRVAQREGGPAARIAVTHPASWGQHKIDLMGTALAAQGLAVMFLAEPQAAALHYAAAERVEPGSTIAVYDLGGGTFDAAVVHKDPTGTFTLLGRPEGLERLGGVDFDDVVFDHVQAAMPEAFAALDDEDPAALAAVAAVRRDCREAKEALSADTEVSIPVLMPSSGVTGTARGSVRLHRSEFEALIRPQIEETVAALRRAITSAGRTPEQLTAVLLVGGSSRIPLVAELVSELLGRPVAVDADPKNAIAKGAALALTPAAVTATGTHGPPRPPAYPGGTGARPVARPGTGAIAPLLQGTPGPLPAAPPQRPPVGAPAFGYDEPDEFDGGGYLRSFDDGQTGAHRPRRSPALLVSAGGATAAAAVIAASLLWPSASTSTTPAGRLASDLPVSVAPLPTSEPALPTVEPEPEPTRTPVPTRRTTVAPPPVTTTVPPVVTTEPVTPTEPPPTTTQPPPTTEPPTGGAGAGQPAGQR